MEMSREKLYAEHAEQAARFKGTPQPEDWFYGRVELCKNWVLLCLSKRTCGTTFEGLAQITRLPGARLQVCVNELTTEFKLRVNHQPDGNDLYRAAERMDAAKVREVLAKVRPRDDVAAYRKTLEEAKDALCGLLKGGGAYVNREIARDILKVAPATASRVITELMREGRIQVMTTAEGWYTEAHPDA